MDSGQFLRTMGKHYNEIFDWAGVNVHQVLAEGKWDPDTTRILDVGAGQGKYRIALGDYVRMDGCEVFPTYVVQNSLRALYDYLWEGDIYDFIMSGQMDDAYDVVILGDVLEHFTRERAKELMMLLMTRVCREVIVVVPYEYPQGPEDGNEHQRHLQPDLTIEVMAREYPELALKWVQLSPSGIPFKGLYRRSSM